MKENYIYIYILDDYLGHDLAKVCVKHQSINKSINQSINQSWTLSYICWIYIYLYINNYIYIYNKTFM